jgi:hypothetical protein
LRTAPAQLASTCCNNTDGPAVNRLTDWIYGNLTMTLDELEAMFLVNGSFYNFINDWFNIIYGG